MRDEQAHDRTYEPPQVTVLGTVENLTAGDDEPISPVDDG